MDMHIREIFIYTHICIHVIMYTRKNLNPLCTGVCSAGYYCPIGKGYMRMSKCISFYIYIHAFIFIHIWI
jgi:hypothetical protein